MNLQPTPAQRRWMDLKFGMFIHFGINTFYDVEWSDGTLDPQAFNPKQFDPDQWCQTARRAGMKFIVLVTKHHDGFCNWPSAHTEYSVRATPFGRDVVGEVVRAAHRHGLEVGLYYSLWDRSHPAHDADDAAYVQYMKLQLAELLTNYGPIVEVWFDGMWKKQKRGWKNGTEEFLRAWREEGALRWRWDEIYAHIKNIQPDCLVLNNSTTAFPGVPLWPVDARPGEKATEGNSDQKIWHCNGQDEYLPLQIETTMSQKGPQGDFQTGSWFWHEWDHTTASREMIRGWLQSAQNRDAVLLLNCGPMASGKLRPEDVDALSHLHG
jgi:alpha-L-fucosidase